MKQIMLYVNDLLSIGKQERMAKNNSLKTYRVIGGIMSVIMLVLMLLSLFFIAAEAGHECHGEDCHICEVIEQCRKTVRRVGETMVRFFAETLPLMILAYVLPTFERRYFGNSLVSQKVRMND